MYRITGKSVISLANVWHRLEIRSQDAESLAEMLAPMDAAGEVMAQAIEFDMEPSDYLVGLETMASDGENS